MKSEIIVICEGSADATFIRTFLKMRGHRRNLRFLNYPDGKRMRRAVCKKAFSQ